MIYYSGASIPDGESTVEKSIGGYISSTQVSNGLPNTIFKDVSKAELGTRETKLLVFKAPSNITKMQFSGGELLNFAIQFAVVTPLYDSGCGKYYFPQLNSSKELPLGVSFHDLPNADIDPPIVVPITLLEGEYVGIWLVRTPIVLPLPEVTNNNQSCTEDSIELLRTLEESLVQTRNISLNIEYS